MTPLGKLIDSIEATGDGRFTVNAPDDWRQGRTLFGGASAGLCYAACERLVPDLPPLRSAQVAFIGPSAGEATLVPTVLRQGKSVTFMACDLIADGVVATRTLFAFGGERASAFAIEAPFAPDVPRPEDCPSLFGGEGRGPTFSQHFDMRRAGGGIPMSGADDGDLLVWVRHRDVDAPTGLVSLVTMGDALPPASIPRFTTPAAISSMTWHFDLADPSRFDANGWMLLRSKDDAVGHGYAGQSMDMWDEAGRPILLGRQNITIFA